MNQEIKAVFDALVDGYTRSPKDEIDDFMDLISDKADVQMIGIGATKPGAYEWFTGKEEIKEIIISDWTFWGDVHFDLSSLRVSEMNDVAWFSLCATLAQTEMSEETWAFFAGQMKEILEDESMSAHDRMFEAAHKGIRRVREKNLGVGHPFEMVITGTLVKEDKWRFHMLHWSMPVE